MSPNGKRSPLEYRSTLFRRRPPVNGVGPGDVARTAGQGRPERRRPLLSVEIPRDITDRVHGVPVCTSSLFYMPDSDTLSSRRSL